MKKLFQLALAGTAAATAAVIGLPATPALAAPVGSSVISASRTFVSDSNGRTITGTVNCPSGYRMVGSGGASIFNADIVFTAMAPTSDFTGARFVATVIQPPLDGHEAAMQLIVYCAPVAQFTDVIVVQTSDHRARPGQFFEGIGRCPAGYYAFGGGGYFSVSGSGFLGAAGSNSTNGPSADGNAWTFSGIVPSSANEQVTLIECAPRTGRDFVVQFGDVVTNPFREATSFVDCPAGYTAVSGGFYASNLDGSVVNGASVKQTDRGGGTGRWFIAGFTQANTKLVALAQCVI
jgi:hypothetical protein